MLLLYTLTLQNGKEDPSPALTTPLILVWASIPMHEIKNAINIIIFLIDFMLVKFIKLELFLYG